ncbi:hypothetical protein AAG906_028751 [Vitis piasezkii]
MTIANGGAAPARLESSAMVVCWILGLGSLVSWHSMLTIGDYYYNLFPRYHPSRVLTLVYQPFALGTMALLAYNEAKIDTRKRNLAGYILFCASTFLLVVLDLATSGRGGIAPYIGICVIVGAFGVADAHVQGGMVGDLSFMCPEFIQSFLAGLAASGALTSALRLMTKAAFDKSAGGERKGAMLFLGISTFLEFLCIILYAFLFPKLPIVKHYRTKAALEGSKSVDDTKQQERLSNKQLFFQNIDYALELFLIYVLTLSIFPGFLFENTGKHQYIPIVKCMRLPRKGLMIGVLVRFLLIRILLHQQNALGNLLVLCLLGGIFAGVALDWLWLIGKKAFKDLAFHVPMMEKVNSFSIFP